MKNQPDGHSGIQVLNRITVSIKKEHQGCKFFLLVR